MNQEKLEQTPWAIQFYHETPYFYEEAIKFAMVPDLAVEIIRSDEAWEAGDYHWVIKVIGEDFWMESFKKKREAISLCKKMNWTITK